MINRSQTTQSIPINLVGSSTFGVYPKISTEKTYNMYISDGFMVPYGGYLSVVENLGLNGRAIFTSNILNRMVVVISNNVYLLNIIFKAGTNDPYQFVPVKIGSLLTFTSDVFIAENNAGQIALSDQSNIYIYNPNAAETFQTFTSEDLGFIPGFITFHDTYFICAASQDQFYSPPANNTWRLSASNDGTQWPDDAQHIGLLETKPDNTQAAIRFPSRGNMIFIMGKTVTEPWFDVGYQLFPYQRSSSFSIDYGCINPATIAATDEFVVWLAQNEKSGPIIMYSNGDMPQKITTDGIDHLFDTLKNPADSEAFIFRRDGHLIYHINFYEDNLSLFYDFNTNKFYHACDENMNTFIAKDLAYFNNQYYFVSRQNGNVYAFDTNYTTYDGKEIPRIRIPKSVRLPSQEFFIANDLGFTIEQGTTNPQFQNNGHFQLITQDGNALITQGQKILFVTQDGNFIVTQDDNNLTAQQNDTDDYDYLVTNQENIIPIYPRVDMSISTDGGYSFGSYVAYNMNPLGKRRNKLLWWQLGWANDFTPQFRFWGFSRFVATDGVLNIRQ
jgi:hypothetical protein